MNLITIFIYTLTLKCLHKITTITNKLKIITELQIYTNENTR